MELKEARKRLQPLLDRYRRNEGDAAFFKNEKQVCQSLIVPFVKEVLGWTTDEPSEFKAEESRGGKRIDYCVYNEGISQFIIEAKAPSRDIFNDTAAYMQALEYGYGKDHDFAILTNFRQIVILAPKIKYRVPEEAEIAQIDVLSASDEDINTILMFEKQFWVSKGRDNPLYMKLVRHKKQIPVDERLLDDMKKWRVSLLKNIKKKNTNLDFTDEKEFRHVEDEVQKFIDRLIFICFCEDKELKEPELKALMNDKKDRYAMKPGWLLAKIQGVFEDYRKEYDSDLFDTSLANRFRIDDVELLALLEDLREPKGKPAYDFKSMEADILGRTYENFIGHIQSGKKIKEETEDKGKRKKEGIYYTPKYIVDYIVNNTVRKVAKGKSYADILKIKIVDPACGSGSFLIRAFDILAEEASKAKKKDLSYEEKKELMLSCIHGVDVDERAVEIANLNLSLRLAERDKKLPILRENIRVGNSLIDDPSLIGYKAFRWNEEFKDIFDSGGFDVVIGNPPYFNIRTNQELQSFVKSRYPEIYTGQNDVLYYFVMKGLNILKEGMHLGFIISRYFMEADSAKKFREFILENAEITKIVDFGNNQIFDGVNVLTIILHLKKNTQQKNNELSVIKFKDKVNPKLIAGDEKKYFVDNIELLTIKQSLLDSDVWTFYSAVVGNVIKKIETESFDLGKIAKTGAGIQSGLNSVYVVDSETISKYNIEKKILRNYVKTMDLKPYIILNRGLKVIRLINDDDIRDYPNVKKYLEEHQKALKKRYEAKKGLCKWYAFAVSRNLDIFDSNKEKIITPIYSTSNKFGYDSGKSGENYLTLSDTAVIQIQDAKYSTKAILAILNSRLMNFYYKKRRKLKRGGYYEYLSKTIDTLPIKFNNDFSKTADSLIDKMILLKNELQKFKDSHVSKKHSIEKEIQKLDKEIDEAVYKLYGITGAEKKIIEASLQ